MASSFTGSVALGQLHCALFSCLYNGHVEFLWTLLGQPSQMPHTHGRRSVYADLLSPLATLSLKTHIPSGFVLSPPESTGSTSSRGSPARGHVTCPAAAEAAWLLSPPDAYEWLLQTQGRPASPLAAEPWAEALLWSPPHRPPALGSRASQGTRELKQMLRGDEKLR